MWESGQSFRKITTEGQQWYSFMKADLENRQG